MKFTVAATLLFSLGALIPTQAAPAPLGITSEEGLKLVLREYIEYMDAISARACKTEAKHYPAQMSQFPLTGMAIDTLLSVIKEKQPGYKKPKC